MLDDNMKNDPVHLLQQPLEIKFSRETSEDDEYHKTVSANDRQRDKNWKDKNVNKEKCKCQICDRVLSSAGNLRRHNSLHTGDKRFKCSYCDKDFSLKTTLVNHIRLHTGEKPYNCDICEKAFRSKANLFVHHKVHTGEKKHKCGHCGQLFIQKGHYKLHLMSHSETKSFICEQCGKCFSNEVLLKRHSMIHKERKVFSCQVCDKKFCNKQTFECHLKAHTGIKDFQCKKCGKNFQYRSALNRHIKQNEFSPVGNCQYRQKLRRSHYECHYCKISLTTKQRLRNHICTHTGEKPYECKDCKTKFTTMSTLKLHLKLHCRGKEPLQKIKVDTKQTETVDCESPSLPKATLHVLHKYSSPPSLVVYHPTAFLVQNTTVSSSPAAESMNMNTIEEMAKKSNVNGESSLPIMSDKSLNEESPFCENEVKMESNNNDFEESIQRRITDVKEEIDIHYEEIDEKYDLKDYI